ncbi:uncharacterized protein CTHT_0056820 [Thermochaetoides thermophila DSM 1495]|uniref:GRF-type domain-containing protein n=1 Tax=Chaetomium thermophilum (strain DSM 1495 / CBS 144.50 / IMI 039719) TaxID=759272 RepID=G0SCD4_CHATD|nr:hypothetical protein CTHT_0056820 [Thermochaetoides thermophila DSM 1495]EGS19060.1 hypothetical protein CTHT_0056820 [Thermochaetoides thermophila DSM 1495]
MPFGQSLVDLLRSDNHEHDSETATTTVADSSAAVTRKGGIFENGVWMCACDPCTEAKKSQVAKEGENMDRWFWRCQNFRNQCQFFLWEDKATLASGARLSSQPVTGPAGFFSARSATPGWIRNPGKFGRLVIPRMTGPMPGWHRDPGMFGCLPTTIGLPGSISREFTPDTTDSEAEENDNIVRDSHSGPHGVVPASNNNNNNNNNNNRKSRERDKVSIAADTVDTQRRGTFATTIPNTPGRREATIFRNNLPTSNTHDALAQFQGNDKDDEDEDEGDAEITIAAMALLKPSAQWILPASLPSLRDMLNQMDEKSRKMQRSRD